MLLSKILILFKRLLPQQKHLALGSLQDIKEIQQFSMMQQGGLIAPDAKIQKNTDGTWGIAGTATYLMPTGGAAITQAQLDYLKVNNPEVYTYYLKNGLTAAWTKYADIISGTVTQAIASASPDMQLKAAQISGLVPKNATSVIVNKDGTISYTVGAVTSSSALATSGNLDYT